MPTGPRAPATTTAMLAGAEKSSGFLRLLPYGGLSSDSQKRNQVSKDLKMRDQKTSTHWLQSIES